MPSERNDIDSIERYLNHQMDGEERTLFEARLQQDEAFRNELTAYRPLLEGFHALRMDGFRQQMEGWEQEGGTTEMDEAELIEWYLSGKLAGPGQREVEKRLAEDEAFAGEVAAYRQLREGFEAARAEAFIGKMETWEKKKAEPQPLLRRLWPRLAAAAAILLVLGLGFNWYAERQFSAGAIAEAYYQTPLTGSTMGGDTAAPEAISQRFEVAHSLFQQGQYQAAYEAFGQLLKELPGAPIDKLSRSFYLQNSEWNCLLAALALTPPPLDVHAEAQRIATTSGHEFQEPAQKLLKRMESPLYRWAN